MSRTNDYHISFCRYYYLCFLQDSFVYFLYTAKAICLFYCGDTMCKYMDRNNSYLLCYFWFAFRHRKIQRELHSYCAALPLVIEASMNAGVEMDEHPVIDDFGCTPSSYHNVQSWHSTIYGFLACLLPARPGGAQTMACQTERRCDSQQGAS
jgi:hypothetical protein